MLPAEGNLGKQEKIRTPKMDSRVAASLDCSSDGETGQGATVPRDLFPHTDCAIKSVTVVNSAVHFTGTQPTGELLVPGAPEAAARHSPGHSTGAVTWRTLPAASDAGIPLGRG